MQFFQDINSKVFAYEDNVTQEEIDKLKPGLTPITESEAKAILNPAPTLADLKTAKNEEINTDRTSAMLAGMTYDGHTWQTDPDTRANLSGVVAGVAAGLPLPSGFSWRTSDNVDVTMDADGVKAFGAAMLAWVNSIYQHSWDLKNTVKSATTNDEVAAIVW